MVPFPSFIWRVVILFMASLILADAFSCLQIVASIFEVKLGRLRLSVRCIHVDTQEGNQAFPEVYEGRADSSSDAVPKSRVHE